MKRSRLLASAVITAAAALLVVALLAFAPGPAGAADEPLTVVSTDVAGYPDVRVVVAAPASLGGRTLADDAFRVTEGGQPRPARVAPLPADHLEVSLVIDTSGSMAGAPLAAAKAAAGAFLGQLPAAVPVSIIGFGASPSVASARSSDRPAQTAAVAGLKAAGDTALYDAVNAGLSQLPAAADGARWAIVLLSDGADTASGRTLEATAGALRGAGVALFAVELRTGATNPEALARLASASGGRVVQASDPAALAGAFDAVAGQLVRQYTLTYPSQARGATDVDVVLETGGVRATARAHLDLPPGPAAAPTATAAPVAPAATSAVGSWALIAGGVLCGGALLVLLLALLAGRAPRAQGLAGRQRGTGLARAAEQAEALGDRVLGRRGAAGRVSGALEAAGMEVRPGELLMAVAAVDLLALLLGWVLLGPLMGLVLAVAVPVLVRVGINVKAGQRRKRFSDQLSDTLQILSGSLRAGHGLAQGIDTVGREAESPTAEEFRRLTIEARLGRDFIEALAALAERIGSEDFQWVVQAIEIQRDVGGDLAEVLDTVAGTIRDRTRIRRQVSALSAEGRMSAWVLMILPFGLGAMLAVTNPDYVSPLFGGSSTGYKLLAVAAGLLIVGGLWLRRIVRPVF